MTGIRTIEDLRQRCWVDDITGCWHWKGAVTQDGHPVMWMPQLDKTTTAGVAICVLKTGSTPKKGVFWRCICDTRGCANPDHRRPGSRSAQMLAAKITRSPLTRARMSIGKCGRRPRLTDEQQAEIRDSSDSLRVLAERYGISQSTASRIRQGIRRQLLAAPGSSVFNFGR